MKKLEQAGRENHFHKFVLFTFPFNGLGQGLYRKSGYCEVGVFHNQGILDGRFADVMAMEKMLQYERADAQLTWDEDILASIVPIVIETLGT